MNRASLDRGFGRCIVIKKSQAVLRKYANRTQDRVVAPAPGPTGRLADKLKGLDNDGLVAPGTILNSGDVTINMQVRLQHTSCGYYATGAATVCCSALPLAWLNAAHALMHLPVVLQKLRCC
jgi:hypothetical protein